MSFYIDGPHGYVVRSGDIDNLEVAKGLHYACNILAHPPNDRSTDRHYDGHGLNESIRIQCDGLGGGGASHRYVMSIDGAPIGYVQFQNGPRGERDSTPGATEAALCAILIDRLKCFQDGPYACDENKEMLGHIEAALDATKKRADARAARGVLRKNEK